ncbi:hypothetical protein ACFL3T_04610 [Patescibacteria group bacterium]
MDFQQNKKPILLIIAIVLIFGAGLAYGYFFSQVNAVESELDSIGSQIAQAENELEELQASDAVLAQRAVNSLDAVKNKEVEWSNVLATLNRITPVDLIEKKPLIEFISYSGSEDGRLSFNVRTQASENVKKLLDAVSKTIEIFDETPDFSNPFVPSVSKSVNNLDQTLLTFVLNVDYNPSSTVETDDENVPRR